jgi:hypothetical protein
MALLMSLPVFVGIEVSASQIARTGGSACIKKEENFTNKETAKAGHPAATGSSANEPNNTAVSIFYHVPPLFIFQRLPSSHQLKFPPLCL